MRVHILFRESSHTRFWCSPAAFAPIVVKFSRAQPDWMQITWFRVWLKWQLLIRGASIPKKLLRYVDQEFEDYRSALERENRSPVGHDIFRSPLPKYRLPSMLRSTVGSNGLKWSTGTESGQGYIDLTNYSFTSLPQMIAAALEAQRGHVYCSSCSKKYPASMVSQKNWLDPVVQLTGAGGRKFICPNQHRVLTTMDWIA